jgi:hypothetical protein
VTDHPTKIIVLFLNIKDGTVFFKINYATLNRLAGRQEKSLQRKNRIVKNYYSGGLNIFLKNGSLESGKRERTRYNSNLI